MTTLAQYSVARAALAEAARVDQIMHVRDEVDHLKLYARQIKDRTLMAEALELQLRCERRLGQLLVAAKDAGQVSRGQPKKNCTDEVQFSRVRLDEAGIDRKLSSKSQKAAKLSERAFEAMVEQARNKIAGTAAKVVSKPGPKLRQKNEQPVPPAPQIEASDFQQHDTFSGLWRSRLRELISEIDAHLERAPSPVDRAYGLKRLDGKWQPLPPHDEITGEVLDEAPGPGSAQMNEENISLPSGLPQSDEGPAASSSPEAPAAGPEVWPEMPPFLDRRLAS